ncbi:MAG: glycosyltransferase family 1 protein [Patescibacteria group bacterium]
MKIAVYANEVVRQGESGVKTYSLEIIKHLLQIDSKNEYTLYCRKDISKKLAPQKAKIIVAGSKKRFWAFSVFAPRVKADRPDVIFVPLQTFPFLILPKDKPKIVITVHDVAFLYFPEHFTFVRRQILKMHTKRAVKFADMIIVPSEATKTDIIRFYGIREDKIKVIYHGSSLKLLESGKKNDPRVAGLSGMRPYILFVGTVQPRKNIARLVQAFNMLKSTGKYSHKLIICGGKGWLYHKIFAEIGRSAFREDIVVVGAVGNDLLASLYVDAALFVMPSLYEGFGLPILEAMSFGVPVVCADNSSLSEIADGAAVLADGYNVEDICRKMEMVLDNKDLQEELSQKGIARVKDFSWNKAAAETLKTLESVISAE